MLNRSGLGIRAPSFLAGGLIAIAIAVDAVFVPAWVSKHAKPA